MCAHDQAALGVDCGGGGVYIPLSSPTSFHLLLCSFSHFILQPSYFTFPLLRCSLSHPIPRQSTNLFLYSIAIFLTSFYNLHCFPSPPFQFFSSHLKPTYITFSLLAPRFFSPHSTTYIQYFLPTPLQFFSPHSTIYITVLSLSSWS